MANDNQRIVFSIPDEETTATTIISDILEKNGFADPLDDIASQDKTPRIVIVNNVAKDFFDEKITEEKMADLFQTELNVSRETATSIINSLKEKLIPFGKKVDVPPDRETQKMPERFRFGARIEPVTQVEKPMEEKETTPEIPMPQLNTSRTPAFEQTKIPASPKPKFKKITEAKPTAKQNKGPDSYREPIE
jgi:hypothetical protein